MFISSTGGLTAGRKNCDFALFPYYTDDKITESAETTGSKTVILVEESNRELLWDPFSSSYRGAYRIERNLYKNAYGNKIIFEEFNAHLDLTFRYQWAPSERFGFVRHATLTASANDAKSIRILDGVQNILPYGVPQCLQSGSSNLVDAYKNVSWKGYARDLCLECVDFRQSRAKRIPEGQCGLVFGHGAAEGAVVSKQLEAFRTGAAVVTERDIKAERGAYFVQSDLCWRPARRRTGHRRGFGQIHS